MARSWTRLHEYLGTPPPLAFDMVKRPADGKLRESDDLDRKEQLPRPRGTAVERAGRRPGCSASTPTS
ncbi:hypothetical protein ACF1BE_32935 [Streptomyces sp. NPDC014991]|uniref:hypothetical protein n=1 Tax=Streptomyces sp. NPDC014991 TaxID=3364935 RepID=UPI0036FD6654